MTDPITRRNIPCNGDFCEEGYDSDGDFSPSFDAFLYEKDMEYYIKKVINSKRGIYDVTRLLSGSSILSTEINELNIFKKQYA